MILTHWKGAQRAMDTIQRLQELTQQRGWSEYRLAKESGLSQSTVANIFHRQTIPSIPTLELLCKAFGISLSQFFANNDLVALTPEQIDLLTDWSRITPRQQLLLKQLLQELQNK